jgi:hypothetical protein
MSPRLMVQSFLLTHLRAQLSKTQLHLLRLLGNQQLLQAQAFLVRVQQHNLN